MKKKRQPHNKIDQTKTHKELQQDKKQAKAWETHTHKEMQQDKNKQTKNWETKRKQRTNNENQTR